MTDSENEQVMEGEQGVEQPAEGQASAGAGDNPELIALQEKLTEAQAKAGENLEGWQRAQAEFANYKKRLAREQEQQSAEVRGRVIKRYLEIVDDLERALAHKPAGGDGAEWAGGVELIYKKMLGYLESEGLTRIDPLGQPFDPNQHEAVAQEESQEHESGIIIEVLRPGYMLAERVLRPAAVKVAK